MKRILLLALAAIALFAAIQILSAREQQTLLNEYLHNLESYQSPTRDFGEPASYIYMDDGLSIGILYPETEYAFLNEAIGQWVNQTAQHYIQQTGDTESAELAVSYECHQVTADIVSVRLQGSFSSNTLAHPVDVIQTFNADLSRQMLLTATDILQGDQFPAFIQLLSEESGVDADDADAGILRHCLLTASGLQVTLIRGDYLPMSEGTREFHFSYSSVADHLLPELQSALVPPSETEPTAPPTQRPTEPPTETAPSLPEPTQPSETAIDPDKPMLALTFDDGPSAHTERLLDIFREHGGQATFFVLGELIDLRPQTLVRIAAEGHEIGNHSWNHKQLTKLSDDQVLEQIMSTRAKILEVSGQDCTIMRPPYGAVNDDVKAVGKTAGVAFINWSVDTRDWESRNAQAVYDAVMANAADGAIILCHDLHKTTVDAMELVIPKLLEEGYQLVTVTQLLEYGGESPKAGKLYFRQ